MGKENDKIDVINYNRLKLAREYYNFSIDEVSKKVKIRKENIENFENGEDFPTYSQLNKLADYYKRPLIFFFFSGNPNLEEEAVVNYRESNICFDDELKRKSTQIIDKAKEYRLNLSEIKSNPDNIFIRKFEDYLKNESKSNSNEIKIEWLREKLDLDLDKQKKYFKSSEKLLEYIREKFYEMGIYIFKDSFKEDRISGICYYDEIYPIIIINNKNTFGRQLFTVFHEVYHIFAKQMDIDFTENIENEEKKCDSFAEEFLIPTNDFRKVTENKVKNDFDNIYIKELANLYCVSESAIKYKLKKLYGIPYSENNSSIRTSNSKGGGSFYFTRISYLGRPYLKDVFKQYYTGKIGISKIGMYTQLKAAHISSLSTKLFGGGF